MKNQKSRDMTNINEIYQEEGFEVLNFDNYCLLEKHGVLSGDKSCSKFASTLLDFIEELYNEGIDEMTFIVHSNENIQDYIQNYIDEYDIEDYSDYDWLLPDWADWELIVHVGGIDELDNLDNADGAMQTYEFEAHLFLKKSSEIFDRYTRLQYSTIIQHEMKHYFDYMIAEKSNKWKTSKYDDLNIKLSELIQKVSMMNDEQQELAEYFRYFFYITSETEASAWLEQTREAGIETKKYNKVKVNGINDLFRKYKKVIELILLWKNDNSQYYEINEIIDLGNIRTYDEFKKFMMDTFGEYMKLRFSVCYNTHMAYKRVSFEKYMKMYIKVLDKQIKKHDKLWADCVQGVDLDLSPEEVKDMLIKKREERLERIRKKKEGKK